MKVRSLSAIFGSAHRIFPLESGVQSLIPVVMSGIIAVYGLVVSVLISGSSKSYSIVVGFLGLPTSLP